MAVQIEQLLQTADILGNARANGGASRLATMQLAGALKWAQGSARIQPVQADLGSLDIVRGLVGPQPAAIIAASNTSRKELINDAALYAYHSSIPWGVLALQDGALIFNSHWVRRNNWFQFPFVEWNNVASNLELFDAVTPEGIVEGRIERLASNYYQPDRFLLSVDDALVDRLDYWRSETLRYSYETKNVDESLQTLFAQFFVLRAIEDRRLADGLPSLRSYLSSTGDVDVRRLRELIGLAQTAIGSELFEFDALKDIPDNVLGGIIRDLYIPVNLPYQAGRYNFAWLDADVLGLAYEKYLSTVLAPIAPPSQLRLFEQPLRDVERLSVRKSGGVYYTPSYLVQYLTERCLDHIGDVKLDELPRIIDFACGSGSFLVSAADALIQRLRAIEPNRNWARELVTGKHIVGIDVDQRAVTMARLSLWLRFTEEPHPLPLPRLEEVVVHGDALETEVWSHIPEYYDVILGNPPFIASGRTPNRVELSKRFRTAQGRYDYSYLFVELAVRRLRQHGVLGLVVPNRLFRNRDASVIRDILTSEMTLLEVLDFGSNEVFENTNAYIGAITAQKKTVREGREEQSVRVINVVDITPRYLVASLIRASEELEDLRDDVLISYNALHPHGSNPWLLVSPAARRSRAMLEEASDPLGAVAGIYQGVRTGSNDIFIVTVESGAEDSLTRVVNGLGESGLVETSLLHPVVFGSDIQRYELISTSRYLIFPYRNNAVIPEAELKLNYPRTYEYLNRYRELLSFRSSIESSGLRWYELVRKRDEAWLQSPKLLIRDLAIEPSFAVDEYGTTYLVGGTAVVPTDIDFLYPLMAYLNSRLVSQFITQLTPTRGGFQKFEPQHLARIPVIRDVLHPGELSDTLAEKAFQIVQAKSTDAEGEVERLEKEIDDILFRIIGLDERGLL